jgi:hypothetical protein
VQRGVRAPHLEPSERTGVELHELPQRGRAGPALPMLRRPPAPSRETAHAQAPKQLPVSIRSLGLRCGVRLHWLPVHASWLDQIEIVFSVLQRKVLMPMTLPALTTSNAVS